MKQKNEHIKELLGKFFEGQTTEAEEQVLSDFFCKSNDVPEDWRAYKELFQSFKTDAFDFCEDELDAMLHSPSIGKARFIRLWRWASVACVAAILALFILYPWRQDTVIDSPPIAEVKPTEMVNVNGGIDVKMEDEAVAKGEKERPLLAETKNIVGKHRKNCRYYNQIKAEQTTSQDISTSEMMETIDILADLSPDDVTITVSPINDGFAVNTSYGNSYVMKRRAGGPSLELISQ